MRPDPVPSAAPARRPAAARAILAAAVAAAALALCAPPASAAWRGGVEGGASVGGDGGTLLRLTLEEDERPLTHRLHADWVRRADGDGDAWRLGYVPRYHFAPNAYGFAELGLRGDAALGIDAEARALAGVGARVSFGPDANAYAEIGAGVVRTDLDDPCEGVGATGGPCAGFDDGADLSALGALRGGGAVTLAERVRLSAAADVEARSEASELRAELSAALLVPGGTASVTVRTSRLSRDGRDAASVTQTFFGYAYGF